MRVNGYGARPGNNGYSGQQSAGDEYNRSFKQIRFTSAEEYATRDVKEYHHYPEQKDLTQERDDKKQQQQQQSNAKNNASKNSGGSAAGGVQAVAQVVVALVGAAVVATSYQTAMAKKAEKQVDDTGTSITQTVDDGSGEAIALTASWAWGEDYESAVLTLTDSTGKVVAKVPATVTTSEEAAKCTTAGKMTYTATAAYEGESYTDTRDKELPALGHDFDSGTEVTLEGGQPAMDFTCNRCSEHFVIQNSLDEE